MLEVNCGWLFFQFVTDALDIFMIGLLHDSTVLLHLVNMDKEKQQNMVIFNCSLVRV